MIRVIATAAFGLALSMASASAQTCSAVPNTLTNGTTADATQVMANFNAILGCIGGLRGYLGGLTMSNDASNPNTVIDSSAGVADSDDVTTMMTLASFTKNANAAWASGTGNGCLDSGSSLATNQWYHLFVIANTSSNIVDELCSGSATSPTLPSGYTKKRRIGSNKTDISAHNLAISQNGDEFLWATSILDANGVAIGSGSRTLVSLSVPPGIKGDVLFSSYVGNSAGGVVVLFTSPDQTDQASGGGTASGSLLTQGAGNYNLAASSVRFNTLQQIGARANQNATSLSVLTYGWIDTRGRFN